MDHGTTAANNRGLLVDNLGDKTARAIVKRVGDTTDTATITGLVSDAITARLAAIELRLSSADADLA